MLIIGGCELSLERNPHDVIEMLDFQNRRRTVVKSKLAIPARGPTAEIIDNMLWVIGGCRGPKDHLTDV